MVAKKNQIKTKSKRPYVVVRTYSAGVHLGELVSQKGQEVILANSRRLWYWKGAATLSEVATYGVSSESKLAVVLDKITLTQAIEIIPTTKKAEENLRGQKEWRP